MNPVALSSKRRSGAERPTSSPRNELPTGAEKVEAVRHMFDAIAGHYETVNAIASFGLDHRWRRHCVDALELPPGSTVLDVGCGTGDLCRELDRHGLRPVGADLSAGMLSHARTRAPLVLADALAAPFRPACFDGAVSGFALRNVVDLEALFGELARVTRPGGHVSLLDLCVPEVPVLRSGHRLWSGYAVPMLGSLLSDAEAYRYLPRSLAYLPPPDAVTAFLEAAGFTAVEHELLSGGASQLYLATRSQATSV
jgi:demethylmenaquinone methyltransferase/2-methoxy-6-polyprenyl-1,4-benzoquinol methylase